MVWDFMFEEKAGREFIKRKRVADIYSSPSVRCEEQNVPNGMEWI